MSEHDEQVRRLLASARADEPIPPAVSARLDDVLAGLVAEPRPATVTSLSGRRRRRAASWAVAAAASVVVGGVALGQLVTAGQDSAESTAGAADTAQAPEALGSDEAGGRAGEADDGGGVASQSRPDPELPGAAMLEGDTALPELTAVGLESDLVALRTTPPRAEVLGELAAQGCVPAVARSGDAVYAVVFDGQPAAVVLRPSSPNGQRALVQPCGEQRPSRSVLLAPVP